MIKYNFFGKDCPVGYQVNDYSILKEAILANSNKPFLASANKDSKNQKHNLKLIFPNQIHSNKFLVINSKKQLDNLDLGSDFLKVDALITNLENVAISVITADCLPILLYDIKENIIAAIHAGWRGAKSGIIENVIFGMQQMGSNSQNIKAIIGPAIRQKSYEVSQEFYDDFVSQDQSNSLLFIKSSKINHFMFDLPSYAIRKLQHQNIGDIVDCEIDTYSNEQNFYSYRRSFHQNNSIPQKNCGRNISIICRLSGD